MIVKHERTFVLNLIAVVVLLAGSPASFETHFSGTWLFVEVEERNV